MTSSGDRHAVDTSVAIAALDSAHAVHVPCRDAVRTYRPVLAGHAAFEVFSVLTRMPGLLSVDPSDASALIGRVFPDAVWLAPERCAGLLARLPVLGVTGGAVKG